MEKLFSFFCEKGYPYMHRFLHGHPEPSGQMVLTPLYVQHEYYNYSGELMHVHELLAKSNVLFDRVKHEHENKAEAVKVKIVPPKVEKKPEPKLIEKKTSSPEPNKVTVVAKVKEKMSKFVPTKKKKK